MNVTITPKPLGGSIRMIESKSHVHRLLIVAAWGNRQVHIGCTETSADIEATVRSLNSLGANIKRTASGYDVVPFLSVKAASTIDCGESGSTLRFLLPVIGALGKDISITLHGRLPKRPLSPLWEELEKHGMSLKKSKKDVIQCSGKLSPGDYTLPGNISSQFISGLLFALPFLDGNSTLTVTGKLESKNYIDMTLDALELFGIKIEQVGQVFSVQGNQRVVSSDIVAEGDWSNAAFWLTAGALAKETTCTALNPESLQGDRAITKILSQFGADINCNKDSTTVAPKPLKGITVDAEQIPDLVPILAVCAANANGTTTITHAERLRIKESDRLATVTEMLCTLGATIEETSDGLIIQGGNQLKGGATVSSHNDHRIAMAAAIAATVCKYPVVITGAQAVNKSYPKFWEHFKSLGGLIVRSDTDE